MNVDKALRGVLAILAVILAGVIGFSLRDTSAKEGGAAPQFTLTTDQGQKVSPTAFGGKVLVLNFWATYCQTCLEEIPSLNVFQRQFARRGVVVVGVSNDTSEKKYRNFLSHVPVSFETARDPKSDISANYGTFQIPETYVIKDGRVMRKYIGSEDWSSDQIKQYVASLL